MIEEYVDLIKNTEEYKRLVELDKTIKKKYALLIMSFKTLEASYLESKQYENYRSDVEEIRARFISKKEELYSKEEVKEYFKLERELNYMLNEDLNELKSAISNKFMKKKLIKL